jgi:heme A synthase
VSTPATEPTTPTTDRARSPLYSALVGLASLGVLLQGVWAGLFIREGQANDPHWVAVHSLDGQVTTALALVATVIAFVQLRARRDLLLGTAALTVLLVVEVGLGEAVGRSHALQVVHIPLALALMGLAVWLPLRARRAG